MPPVVPLWPLPPPPPPPHPPRSLSYHLPDTLKITSARYSRRTSFLPIHTREALYDPSVGDLWEHRPLPLLLKSTATPRAVHRVGNGEGGVLGEGYHAGALPRR